MDPKNTSPERASSVPSSAPLTRRVVAGFIHLFRPLLKVNLLAYRVDTANALFPIGIPAGEVDAPAPVRMLFVGDSAASSYGVLNHGLGVVSQTARNVARELASGCTWTTITDAELTMARTATEIAHADLDVDVVVVVLGPPDVLLGTTATEWSAGLHTIIDTVRRGRHPDCPVVIAAVPPMYRFRAMPRFVQRLLALQITRLNRASLALAESIPGISYSPFPSLETCTEFIQDSLNWRTVHSLWGKQLGATAALALASHLGSGRGIRDAD
ncbi:SGNH/GDSL hydrolase family protein [Salinibacterium sp. SWN1162]|uniref:SGNH/GDSL hydrolase family protein n=1 Tax=Salinibacterium sp. SWN1162 TaxID=2792053 RepID=UPI0027DC75C8|nr:SGNH/GDSL hydrolase family protein [Salinibacterium sp. SWN1162]